MRIIFIYMLIALFANGQNDIVTIDLDKLKPIKVPASNFVSKMEYIPLELTKNSLLDEYPAIYITDKYVITSEIFKDICLFNYSDGSFIRNLSRKGNGPDDYLFPVLFHALDKDRNIFYVDAGNTWRGIDIGSNKCIKEIRKPKSYYQNENKYQNYIRNFYPYKDSLYIGFANNMAKSDFYELYVFNESGIVVKTINNGGSALFERKNEYPSDYGHFQEINSQLYFKASAQCDTVFLVTDQCLKPSIILNLGRKGLEGYQCSNILQTERYAIFNITKLDQESKRLISYSYIYDKTKKELYSGNQINNLGKCGFANDIDGIGTLYPIGIDGNKLIGIIIAKDLLSSINENSLSDRGLQLVKNVQFDDNPIVVIATMR